MPKNCKLEHRCYNLLLFYYLKALMGIVKRLRTANGKETPTNLLVYWRRVLSKAFHVAMSRGTRAAMKILAKQYQLQGWRQLNLVQRQYIDERLQA